ncbi:MAG: M20/M25/M40 family metallo-hydrolase [Ginsengibacter sp.]
MKQLLLFILIVTSTTSYGQKLKKADRAIIDELTATVTYLSSDELEGRRTGTKGEKLAYEFLSKELKESGLEPKGEDAFLQHFEMNEGKKIMPETNLSFNGNKLEIEKDFFPFIFSPNRSINSYAAPAIKESDAPWFLDIKELLETNSNNPHFDITEAIKTYATEFKEKGATALIVYNTGATDADLKFEGKSKTPAVEIPVIFIQKDASKKYLSENTTDHKIVLNVSIGEKKRKGTNVIGYLDNGASNTIVLGAHYDHLGYGEDHNSLWTGKPEIHNGADDNASGTATVLQLAKFLKNSKSKNFKNSNYLFIFFSGEELGLFGSKYFTEHPTINLSSVNYMINLDMVGRLNEETKAITIGGYGTSPIWSKVLNEKSKELNVKFDSSGIGPSDHTSFYLKEIPVLFFFTGTHSDYHKPSDDVEKINFIGQYRIFQYITDVIAKTNKEDKLTFLKTREPQMGSGVRFTVSLGVMPDYTYSGSGVHIDGVIDGRIADKSGIKTGDVIIKIGEFGLTDVNEYMTALSKFKKGDATTVTIRRGKEELVFNIVF